jgi:hypothetical protein
VDQEACEIELLLEQRNDKNVVEMISESVMICTGGYEVGRKFTNT